MNMNQLRYFIGVAEYQSFTKAAASYYITQTAITQQIRALENHLGVQLFDRNTRPVRLTPEGSVFLREAKADPGACGTGGAPGPGGFRGTGGQPENWVYQGI